MQEKTFARPTRLLFCRTSCCIVGIGLLYCWNRVVVLSEYGVSIVGIRLICFAIIQGCVCTISVIGCVMNVCVFACVCVLFYIQSFQD